MNGIEIALGVFAIISGLLHIVNGKATQKYAITRGFLGAERAVGLAAMFLIGCGVVCFLPDLAEYGGYGIALFLILCNFTLHKFWDENDRMWRYSEGLHFLKNLGFAAVIVMYFQQ